MGVETGPLSMMYGMEIGIDRLHLVTCIEHARYMWPMLACDMRRFDRPPGSISLEHRIGYLHEGAYLGRLLQK
jgi:hypothetical protein